MGTNYYLIEPEKRCDHCGQTTGWAEPALHIGKSSAGWHFSLNTSVHKDEAAWKVAIDEGLKRGCYISDSRYGGGDPVSREDFWSIVEMRRHMKNCQSTYVGPWPINATCVNGVDYCPFNFS